MDAYLSQIKKLLECIEITDFEGRQYSYEDGITRIVDRLWECKMEKASLFLCGNGGSAGIAQHMTADFMKNAGIKAQDILGATILTCISNDLSYEYVFGRQLEMLAGRRDVLIAISSSGESENIVRAIETMRTVGGNIITLTGFLKDNRIRKMGDSNVYVPVCRYGMTESIHNMIIQQCVDKIVELGGVAMK